MKLEFQTSPVTEVKKGIYHMLQMGNNYIARNIIIYYSFYYFVSHLNKLTIISITGAPF